MIEDVVFVDCETTGLDPDRHEIWEVACSWFGKNGLRGAGSFAQTDDEDNRWHEATWQLPVNLALADPFSLKIGGFYDRYEPPLAVLSDFARNFERITRGKHLAGAVVSFDEERLRKLLKANGACPGWHYHLIDVEILAVGYLWGIDRGDGGAADQLPYNSNQLSTAVGVDPEQFERHTALGDVRWAKAIFEAVLKWSNSRA